MSDIVQQLRDECGDESYYMPTELILAVANEIERLRAQTASDHGKINGLQDRVSKLSSDRDLNQEIRLWRCEAENAAEEIELLRARVKEMEEDAAVGKFAEGLLRDMNSPTPKHVCGESGYNPMIDPPCPACEALHEGWRRSRLPEEGRE